MKLTGSGLIAAVIALVWTVWMLFLGLDDRRRVTGFGDSQSSVVQHLVAFAVLGALLSFIVSSNPFMVWLVLVTAAVLGEFIQLATADRDFALSDIILGAIGAGVGIGAGVVLSESRYEFAALVVPCVLMIASPFLLVVVPDGPETTFPEDCAEAPERVEREPAVLLEETGLDARTMPVQITEPTAAELRRRILATNELSVEVWFETSDLAQSGPARVFTISTGTMRTEVNFHIGIEGADLSVRLRTSCELFTWVVVEDIIRAGDPQHVVVTWSAGVLATWVNGTLVREVVPRWGDFERWDPDALIIVGDEADGGRRFEGTVDSVTMWDVALQDGTIKTRASSPPD